MFNKAKLQCHTKNLSFDICWNKPMSKKSIEKGNCTLIPEVYVIDSHRQSKAEHLKNPNS